jgi:histidine triad (HIT) family protein
MAHDCVFCSIVAGDLPSRTVYEDDDVLAFLDVNPLARGHTLVVPRDHHERVGDLPAATRAALFDALGALTPRVEAAMDADGVTVGINDGRAAGQEVMHVHGHLVPRTEGDGAGPLHALGWPRPELADDEFDDVAAAIRDAV